VDSLFEGPEYVDRVLFGYAAGIVVDLWCSDPANQVPGGALAAFHDWTSGAGLLYLAERLPGVATAFAIHRRAREGQRGEHSLEAACAREADLVVTLGGDAAGAGIGPAGNGHDVPDAIAPFADLFRAAIERARARDEARPGRARPRSAPLPLALAPLEEVARDWAWTWDPEGRGLFSTFSPATWEATWHDAARTLREAPDEDVRARADDAAYVARVARVRERLRAAREGLEPPRVAYFSAEFGIHESLPVYSGGLGILAGDHLKSASDARLPLVAVGLLYRKGRSVQRLTPSGDQTLGAVAFDPSRSPLTPVLDAGEEPLEVVLDVAGHAVRVRSWCARVGRVDLHLLDCDVEGNRPEDRAITHLPYPSDPEARLRKELVLGRGGTRLLARLGIHPRTIHLNEGHPAFAALEAVSWEAQRSGAGFEEALARVRARTVFTTHTPVPAGHDRFDERLVRLWCADLPEALGVPWERILSLGRDGESFNMTRLAVSLASRVNGVSRVHAEVSRSLLARFVPAPAPPIPVEAVTNGVHLPTWTSLEMATLLGAKDRAVEGEDFRRAPAVDPALLWEVRRALRRRFLQRVRARIERRVAEGGASAAAADRAARGLDEGALLVGFARRFAAYKRGDLLLTDLARLERIVGRTDRPVRVFVAGKAHPADLDGQRILRRIHERTRKGPLEGRVLFLEDYGIELARLLVQGADVWLNNPLRGLEASGTSGMKAAANGGLNLSVLDGWWPEAYDGENGWAIGPKEPPADGRSEDAADADALYRLFEEEVVPLFFDRDADGVPRRWLARVARSLATIPPVFDTRRMVAEYARWGYEPATPPGTSPAPATP
jgi:starch phosphorylase